MNAIRNYSQSIEADWVQIWSKQLSSVINLRLLSIRIKNILLLASGIWIG